ncbi:MAG TPA: hypothetical protein VK700_20225 [Steroidobacteraceae bacterium]|jgi:hypothetical protein|nr:hypothetical protein [Steroidobacteraceae bacterium]
MQGRLLAASLAVIAFAATLAVTRWQFHAQSQPQPQSQSLHIPVAAVRSRAVPQVVPHPVIRKQNDAPAADPDDEDVAPQPPLPDSAALPSYEEDQAARNADALRSQRSR